MSKTFISGLIAGGIVALGIMLVYSNFVRSDDVDVYGVQGISVGNVPSLQVFAKNPADGCNAYRLTVKVTEEDEEAVVIKPSLSKLPSSGDCTLQLGGGSMSIDATVPLTSALGRRLVYQDSRDRDNYVPKIGLARGSGKGL